MKNSLNIKPQLVVGGFTPLTTIDYPGELAAVIFLQGCPWRCGYCQNTNLIPTQSSNNVSWQDILSTLIKRQGLLDAVVFSGGEPTLHSGLIEAIRQVKNLGYKIGLHTAGIYPERLKKILPLIDWVGMDIKSSLKDYISITQTKNSGERAWQSAKLILESGIKYEFRTTVHPDMLSEQQLIILTEELINLGVKNYVLQECITKNCLDKSKCTIFSPTNIVEVLSKIPQKFDNLTIREKSKS